MPIVLADPPTSPPSTRGTFVLVCGILACLTLAAWGCNGSAPDPNPGPKCTRCDWPLADPVSTSRRLCDECHYDYRVLAHGTRITVTRGIHSGRRGKVINYSPLSGYYLIDFVSRSVTGAPAKAMIHHLDITVYSSRSIPIPRESYSAPISSFDTPPPEWPHAHTKALIAIGAALMIFSVVWSCDQTCHGRPQADAVSDSSEA